MNNRTENIIWTIILILVLFMAVNITKGYINNEHEKIQAEMLQEIQTLKDENKVLSEPLINERNEFLLFAYERKDPKFAEIVNLVYDQAKEHNVDPHKILSIMQVESEFNPKAISKAGAYGLMQVKYSTWKDFFGIKSHEELFEPSFNINIGIQIYKQYKEKNKGDIERALHMYNAGYMKIKTNYPAKVMNSRFFKRD